MNMPIFFFFSAKYKLYLDFFIFFNNFTKYFEILKYSFSCLSSFPNKTKFIEIEGSLDFA